MMSLPGKNVFEQPLAIHECHDLYFVEGSYILGPTLRQGFAQKPYNASELNQTSSRAVGWHLPGPGLLRRDHDRDDPILNIQRKRRVRRKAEHSSRLLPRYGILPARLTIPQRIQRRIEIPPRGDPRLVQALLGLEQCLF